MKHSSLCLQIALIASLATSAWGGQISGRVVDANGVGVPNVDIDVDNTGSGGDPTVSGDFTDASGFFTTTVNPDGVYTISFRPPAPPTTTHLVKTLEDVVVVGTVNLGTVTLDPGVGLLGRAVSGVTGLPVGGVNLDVIDSTGTSLTLVGDTSAPNGQFGLAVPLGAIELRFKTEGVAGATLAPLAMPVFVGGPTNLGDVSLEQGYTVSALLKTAVGNLSVDGVDLDVIDTQTGEQLFTPGDNSNGSGLLDVILPAGTFDLEFCPPFADKLVAELVTGQAVSSNLFLGTLQLDPGVVLSGVIQGAGAGPLENADVDVLVSGTGAQVLLCGDNTNASGAYSIVVPTGVFDVTFSPPPGQAFGPLTIGAVSVTGNQTLNGTLPACGGVVSYCTAGITTSGCQASLSASGAPSGTAGSGFTVSASGVEGQKDGLFFYGFSGAQANNWGNGTSFQCVVPPVFRTGLLNGTGTNSQCDGSFGLDLNAYWTTANPNKVPAAGQQIWLQLWFRDPQNTSNQTTSLSNALQFATCP